MLVLDDVRLSWLDGGAFKLDGGAMFGPVPKSMWAKRYPADEMNVVPLEARVVLVETPSARILIEAGFGHHLTERQRRIYNLQRESRVLQQLAAMGLTPEDIDWVVLTHLHLDHGGGVVSLDEHGVWRPVFARARHVVQRTEALEALHPDERSRHVYNPEGWAALEAAGLVELVEGRAEISPGIEVFWTGGHSRGHQGVRISVGGQASLHLGDLLPTHAHLNPLWITALDDYPQESIRAKREWLTQASRNGWWVCFSHDARVLAGKCTVDFTLEQPLEPGSDR